jgi:uncharacterized protein (TIGR02594 family)
MTTPDKLIGLMRRELGTTEAPGTADNPRIVEYLLQAGAPANMQKDVVAWCAAFQCWALEQIGLPSTNSLLARSFLKYGTPVTKEQSRPGDLIILERGEPWQGHVGTLTRWTEGGNPVIISGNTNNRVTEQHFTSKVVGIRRPPFVEGAPAPTPVPQKESWWIRFLKWIGLISERS